MIVNVSNPSAAHLAHGVRWETGRAHYMSYVSQSCSSNTPLVNGMIEALITAITKPSMISQTAQILHIQKPFNTSLGSRIDSLHNPLAFEHRFPACFARFIYSETH
jgi:hypothetical protein